jgi:hypothetical protein
MRTVRSDAYDDDEVVRDGESVRVPVFLMDGVQRRFAFDARDHQPGYRVSDDATVRDAQKAARHARDRWVQSLGDAWKRPGRAPGLNEPDADASQPMMRRQSFGDASPDDNGASMREAAYRQHCNELENAWRSPAGAAAPETHRRLWKAEPSHAAPAIEEQRRRWTVER